jgi:hypothetical protein
MMKRWPEAAGREAARTWASARSCWWWWVVRALFLATGGGGNWGSGLGKWEEWGLL